MRIYNTFKVCSKCKKEKHFSEFHRNKSSKDKLRSICKNCQNTCNRNYYHKPQNKEKISKKQKEYFKNKRLKDRYGITSKIWSEMFDEQKGKCAICGKHQENLKISLCVDHNHKTGKVRGLLCQSCNAKLAIVENKKFLEFAIRYLNNGS